MRRLISIFVLAFFMAPAAGMCPSFMRNQTACTCTDYVDGLIVHCSGAQGPLMVEELKKAQVEVRELSLERANIVEIGARAFKNLRIKKLTLDSNRIKSIQKDAFRGLESSLQELSMNGNRMREVPTEALEGLRALNTLSIRCNKIGNLSEQTLQNLPSLIELNIGCNRIASIHPKAFAEVKNTLQNVILDSNHLTEVPTEAVADMPSLIALHMKYNRISKLEEGGLCNMSSLSMLTLSGNSVAQISKNFTYSTPNLRYIYLNDNALTSIEAGTMKQFAQAEIIDLSYNNLPEITVDMFSGMEALQHLNLEANAIKDIAPAAFATTPLLLLWLPHNCLTAVSPNMFQGAPFLKQVSLAHNNVRTIQPFSFAHLANLHTLDLSSNKIHQLQPSSIMGSDFLTVRVQENPMVCDQNGFHVMNGREAINLTTEANLVCQTDYVHDQVDRCPRRLERPVRPPCCGEHSSSTTNSSVAEHPSTATSVADQPSTTSAIEQQSPMTATSTPATPKPATATIESRAAMRARKLNMERFFRLAKRPKAAPALIHNTKEDKVMVDMVMPKGESNATEVEVVPAPIESNQISPSPKAQAPPVVDGNGEYTKNKAAGPDAASPVSASANIEFSNDDKPAVVEQQQEAVVGTKAVGAKVKA